MKRLALAAALVLPLALGTSAAVRPAAESEASRAHSAAASRCPVAANASGPVCPRAAMLACPARAADSHRAAGGGAAPRGRCPAASRSIPLPAAGGGVV